eukprot:CAMPEP_0170498432 /NCGR_PEP_ID=MMETSP0208-20121228/27806_1 /TAXON_ID=197538 /ORGANISM="Strombidium inclinatum, Strain S3" /LENGTH=56 /DNA_ID=CAMNT_0010775603 /DNA_START=585 /DNA_END=755 /DNA_ORIENTATION=+
MLFVSYLHVLDPVVDICDMDDFESESLYSSEPPENEAELLQNANLNGGFRQKYYEI